ncbi:MAG: hypothetical protein C0391_07150 [Anaerolinea sp.]|nr:hypothetical protein [Anaerolinea sp.]
MKVFLTLLAQTKETGGGLIYSGGDDLKTRTLRFLAVVTGMERNNLFLYHMVRFIFKWFYNNQHG